MSTGSSPSSQPLGSSHDSQLNPPGQQVRAEPTAQSLSQVRERVPRAVIGYSDTNRRASRNREADGCRRYTARETGKAARYGGELKGNSPRTQCRTQLTRPRPILQVFCGGEI